MSRVILFNGGAAGGVYIQSNFVRAIPRFAPAILAHLRAVFDLLRSARDLTPEARFSKELLASVTRISNLAVERVEAAVGPLDKVDSLVYLEGNGGFICGSIGAPPRLVEWPPVGASSLDDLVQRGLLAEDVIDFLHLTNAKGLKMTDVLEDPAKAAKTAGIPLSALAIANLMPLAPTRFDQNEDPISREVIAFFYKVIEDGRFVDTWTSEPAAVAKALGFEPDIQVIDRILGSSAVVGRYGDAANLSIEQGVVVVIVAAIVLTPKIQPEFDNIRDLSDLNKF